MLTQIKIRKNNRSINNKPVTAKTAIIIIIIVIKIG